MFRSTNGGDLPSAPPDGQQAGALPIEIELKLIGAPKDLRRIWSSPIAGVSPAAGDTAKRLENIYYDTPDMRLKQRGFALRVRRIGRRYVQTLKAGSHAEGAMAQRLELEAPVSSRAPDINLITDPDVREAMGMILPGELEPIFVNRVQRKIRVVSGADPMGHPWVIEMAFDTGSIEVGGKSQPIAEIELELLKGSPAAIFDLALELHGIAPVQIETRSKAARGYALAAGDAPPWRKAERIALARDVTVDDALAAIFRTCFEHWTANQAPVLYNDHPESVHQIRVGLRRFRSALSVFGGCIPPDQLVWLKEEAKWAAGCFGPTRDLDVFIESLLAPVVAAQPGDANLVSLQHTTEAACDTSRAAARAALLSPRYSAFVLAVGRWLESRAWRTGRLDPSLVPIDQPLIDLARSLLDKRHRKSRKLAKDFVNLPIETRHELRISLKKLRYTAEFVQSLFPKTRARRYLKALEAMLDNLGHLNDVATAQRLLQHCLDDHRTDPQVTALHAAAGTVIGWHSHRATGLDREGAVLWRSFAAETPFWRGK